jgi:hypothetical protein
MKICQLLQVLVAFSRRVHVHPTPVGSTDVAPDRLSHALNSPGHGDLIELRRRLKKPAQLMKVRDDSGKCDSAAEGDFHARKPPSRSSLWEVVVRSGRVHFHASTKSARRFSAQHFSW